MTDEAIKILEKARELNPHGVYVFEPNGEIMTTDSFNRRFKRSIAKKLAFLTILVIKSVSTMPQLPLTGTILTTLSYLMGHSETATTLHYLRNVNKRKNDPLCFVKNWGFPHKVFKGVQTFESKKRRETL